MTNEEVVAWLRRLVHEGSHLRVDSRLVEPGDVFVALPGRTSDGRHFIRVAEARGAAGAIYEARENEAAPEHHPMPTLPASLRGRRDDRHLPCGRTLPFARTHDARRGESRRTSF